MTGPGTAEPDGALRSDKRELAPSEVPGGIVCILTGAGPGLPGAPAHGFLLKAVRDEEIKVNVF